LSEDQRSGGHSSAGPGMEVGNVTDETAVTAAPEKLLTFLGELS